MSALTQIWNEIHTIFTAADWITLVIGGVIIVAAGFVVTSLNSVISATFLSLIAFALLNFVRAITLGKHDVTAYVNTDWRYFVDMHMLTLVAYIAIFGVLIAVVYLIRSLVQR